MQLRLILPVFAAPSAKVPGKRHARFLTHNNYFRDFQ